MDSTWRLNWSESGGKNRLKLGFDESYVQFRMPTDKGSDIKILPHFKVMLDCITPRCIINTEGRVPRTFLTPTLVILDVQDQMITPIFLINKGAES